MSILVNTFYCPHCHYKLKKLPNNKVGFGYLWMCSNINNGCRTFLEDDKGKPMEGYKHSCPFCNSGLKLFKGEYGLYWSCLDFKKCNKKFKDNDGEPVLPIIADEACIVCGSKIIQRINQKGNCFWSCSSYPKCKESYRDNYGKPDMGGAIINVEINVKKDSKNDI